MIRVADKPQQVPFAQTKCGGCTALCCSYFALEIDAPEEPADFENLRWYIIHQGVNIFVDDGVWFLQIFRKCTWLEGNRCGRYDDRPQICREYSDELCDRDGAESDLTFRSIEELEAYRDEWVARWEAKRARRLRARRKAARRRREEAASARGHHTHAGKVRAGRAGHGRRKAALR